MVDQKLRSLLVMAFPFRSERKSERLECATFPSQAPTNPTVIDAGTVYRCHPTPPEPPHTLPSSPPPPHRHRHHRRHLVNKGQAIRHLEGQLICHPSTNVSASDLVHGA